MEYPTHNYLDATAAPAPRSANLAERYRAPPASTPAFEELLRVVRIMGVIARTRGYPCRRLQPPAS
jgi:hypothetical protein